MKTLAEFKRRIQKGIELETIHARFGSYGIRTVSIVQSNSFALKTKISNEEVVDSWCQYPSAKDIEFPDKDTAAIYWGEGEKREKIITYKFI